MNCFKCNAAVSPDSNFCTQCGAPSVRPEAASASHILAQNIILTLSGILLAILVVQNVR